MGPGGGPEILDVRRSPRVPLRLAVRLSHHDAIWRTETADVGPSGCQVVTSRLVAPGRTVQLSIECPVLKRNVPASGHVAWARSEPPARLGISFEVPPAERGWFVALLRKNPQAEEAARRALLGLRRDAMLHLGEPPAVVVDFSDDELELLRAVGAGATAGAVAEALGGRFMRARGLLFALVARRLVLLRPGIPGAERRWEALLRPRAQQGPLEPPPRSPDVQRLYDEAIAHLGSGRFELALARFRAALELSPGDAVLADTVQRLARWR